MTQPAPSHPDEADTSQQASDTYASPPDATAPRTPSPEISEQLPEAFFALDDAMRVTYFHGDAARLFGRSREQVLEHVLWEVLPEAADPAWQRRHEQARARGEHVTYEIVIPQAAGDGRRLSVVLAPETDDSRAVVGWVGYVMDMSRRARTDALLQDRERLFRATFENAAVGIAHVAPDGRWLDVNGRLCAILGYTRAELLAGRWQDITYPEDLDTDLAYVREMLVGARDRYGLEKRYRRKDGTLVWAQLTVALMRDAAGTPTYFISVIEDISARKRAEEALQASEERLRLALDASSSGTFVWYPDEDRGEPDARMLVLFGLPPDGTLNLEQALATLIHVDDRARYAAGVAQALDPAGTGELHEDIRILLPGGAQRWLAITGRTIFDGDEGESRRALRIIGTAVDITERKSAEEALRESEEKFHLLADNMLHLAWMADATGERFWYNRRWYEYTGTTWEQMRGRGWTRVHPADTIPRVQAQFQQSQEVGEPWETTFLLRGQDGGYRRFLMRATPIRDADGAVVRWFGTNTDVEDQWRLQEALGAANAALTQAKEAAETRARELSVTLDTMSDAVVLIGPAGEVVRTNSACFRLLQIEHSPAWQATYLRATVAERNALMRSTDLSGRPLTEDEWPGTRLLHGETFTSAQAQEIRITGLAGRERVVSVSGVPLRDAQGRPQGGVEVLHDITDRYEREHERAQMLHLVAHELRAPLTVLKGIIELNQLRAARGMVLQAEHLEPEARAVERMERLINDLLDAARADTAQLELHRSPTDLAALCEQVASEQMAASGRGIALQLPAAPVMGVVDGGRVAQVVGNLLSNALKYSPAEATVSLQLHRDGGDAVIAVCDTGPGIREEALPRLFERFYRAPGAQVLHGTGVGLGIGLYLCKQIVERHGGTIAVESRVDPALGHGTTFTVRLPSAPAENKREGE